MMQKLQPSPPFLPCSDTARPAQEKRRNGEMGGCEMGLQGVSTWLFFQLGAGKALLVEVRGLSSRCWYCSIL